MIRNIARHSQIPSDYVILKKRITNTRKIELRQMRHSLQRQKSRAPLSEAQDF